MSRHYRQSGCCNGNTDQTNRDIHQLECISKPRDGARAFTCGKDRVNQHVDLQRCTR